jgi:demethylmacrocin O-methyltransferase
MKSLDEIMLQTGSDKASKHPTINGHDYCRHYDKVFSDIRLGSLKVLEVGVASGVSIQGFLEYFPQSEIFGVDIVYDTNAYNSTTVKAHPRYTFTAGDQGNQDFWKLFVSKHGSNWDIFIDDGSHFIWHIIPCFEAMWPHIKPGGYYAIEDLAVGYGAGSVFVREDFPRHMQWVGELLDKINWGQDSIDSMYFARELAILKKKS